LFRDVASAPEFYTLSLHDALPISVLAAFSFYFAGLQHLEPTRAVVVSCLEPVFSIVLAAILLGEVLRPLQAVGIMLVLAAIVGVDRKSTRLNSSHDQISYAVFCLK